MATSIAVQQEALTRAVSSQSLSNYAVIIRGFMAKGLPESAISPRENVFTYNAWKALGRQVKKGEHGVKCLTFIMQRNKRTGREEKRPWTTTVFHVSQTEPVGRQSVRLPQAPSDMPCYNGIIYGNEPDATPENVPYAGEDEASRESGLDDAIAAYIQKPTLSIEKFHDQLAADGARFEHVKTDEVDYLLTPVAPVEKFSPDATIETFTLDENCNLVRETPEVIPAPAPKESAYDRAMRGETVSIMDIIDEQQREQQRETLTQHDRRINREYNAARRNVQKVYQTKTVEF